MHVRGRRRPPPRQPFHPAGCAPQSAARFLYVFELKLERGPDPALGQVARIIGWIKGNMAGGRQVFGVVVARSFDEKLRFGARVVPGVTLLEYEVEFRVREVGEETPLS